MNLVPLNLGSESGLSCSLPKFGDMSLAHANLDEFLERDKNPSGSPMMEKFVDSGLIEPTIFPPTM